VSQPGQTEQVIGGYWRESEYFSYLTVPKAGHFVPANYYQPSYQFFADYLSSRKLVCHNEADGCSVVAYRCEAMNQCSGKGICGSNGQCSCAAGWKGADCSLKSTSLTDGLRKFEAHTGPKYFSFTK
jgi:hypothetical protein